MKITPTYLRQVIKEELEAVLAEEEKTPVVDGIVVDDATMLLASALDEAGDEIGKFSIDVNILKKKLDDPKSTSDQDPKSDQFIYNDGAYEGKEVNIDADRDAQQIRAILSQLKDDINEA